MSAKEIVQSRKQRTPDPGRILTKATYSSRLAYSIRYLNANAIVRNDAASRSATHRNQTFHSSRICCLHWCYCFFQSLLLVHQMHQTRLTRFQKLRQTVSGSLTFAVASNSARRMTLHMQKPSNSSTQSRPFKQAHGFDSKRKQCYIPVEDD